MLLFCLPLNEAVPKTHSSDGHLAPQSSSTI